MIEPIRSNFSPFDSAHSPFNFKETRATSVNPKGTFTRKMLLQPKCNVRNPPKKGPIESPRYTAATFIPKALPLSSGGKTDVKRATPVPNIIAAPIPWKIRKQISIMADLERIIEKEATVNVRIPTVKILFLPWISATLPNGTRNIAEAKRYAVATQLKEIASIKNSFPMEGSATLTDDTSKGVRKAATVVTSMVIFLVKPSSISVSPSSLEISYPPTEFRKKSC
jgi:hypothetical protein